MTNHELNVKAAEACGMKWGGYDLVLFPAKVGEWGAHIRLHGAGDRDNDVWSPAESIEDAMGLLLGSGLQWRIDGPTSPPYWVDLWVAGDPVSRTHDQLPAAIAEAFIAAMGASDGSA